MKQLYNHLVLVTALLLFDAVSQIVPDSTIPSGIIILLHT